MPTPSGANGLKLAKTGHSVEEVVGAAIAVAKKAAAGTGTLVALDVGPLGELLEPMGTLSFERAYDLFREMAEAGAKAGADLIVVETMTDLYEAKAALLAAKEAAHLPVFVTMSFDAGGGPSPAVRSPPWPYTGGPGCGRYWTELFAGARPAGAAAERTV